MDIFDDPSAAPVDPAQALINWKPDEVKTVLGPLMSPQSPVRPQVVPPQAPPLPPAESMDWRELLKQMGPVIGLLGTHGNGTTNAAFLQGWEHGKSIYQQEQQAKKDEARQKLEKGSQLLNDVASHVAQIDNLTDYDNYIKSAEPPLVSLGIVQPGELRDRFPFDMPKALRKQISAKLDDLEKSTPNSPGFNLDDLAKGGSHITLDDGTTVPISAALQLLKKRPLDASNQPIPRPTKSDSAPSTDLDRLAAAYARDTNKKVGDLTYGDWIAIKRDYEGKQDGGDKTPALGTLGDYMTTFAKKLGKAPADLTLQEKDQARQLFASSTKDPEMADINKNLAQLRLDAAEAKSKQGATGGLDPEGVEYSATQYRLTGKMPPMGMGSAEARAAIINTAAKQAKELGQAPAVSIQKQAAYKADGAALQKMTTMGAAAESFETKALAQADIVENLSNKVDRTQFPIINSALLRGEKTIAGDQNTQLLYNAVTTFTSEYAKIMEGSTGSAAASSDSARKAAAELISPALNKGTLKATLDLMRREMRLTIEGYDATKAHITERMGGANPVIPPAPTPSAPGAPKNDPLGLFK